MTQTVTVGPLLRYVDETTACVWVEMSSAGEVTVRAGERSWSAHTFTAHGHHFAIVDATGLEAGDSIPYTVEAGGDQVWPEGGSDYPMSRLRTIDTSKPLRLGFGSCRTSVPHDEETNATHGIDALRAYALRLMTQEQDEWPALMLFLGDQVYADVTSDAMREFIASRRDIEVPPGEELADFVEYCHLYKLSWSDPVNRWLLSTMSSAMIFDDHDIRDDWNTSYTWRQDMERTSWWHGRIVGGLASYWIYQHLGNISPAERAEDLMWQQIHQVGPTVDVGGLLDTFAAKADGHPDTYRWSYSRDLGGTRVVVVDSRSARVLTPDARAMLDDEEFEWLDAQLTGGFDHVLIGTSLPFMLPVGLHNMEAWDEAVAEGAWGPKRGKRLGEAIRQGVDLEHWGAFQDSFRRVSNMVCELAAGERGRAPSTVMFLSGDVHHSYLAEADVSLPGRILQAVCSPIRNPMPRSVQRGLLAASSPWARRLTRRIARAAKVPDPPFTWTLTEGPWFDNNVATADIDGPALQITWEAGVVEGDRHDDPGVRTVRSIEVVPPR